MKKKLLIQNGNKLIPDKIIINSDEVRIIDFKTGQATDAHKEQIISYVRLLKDIGYKNVIGELFYTESMEFETFENY